MSSSIYDTNITCSTPITEDSGSMPPSKALSLNYAKLEFLLFDAPFDSTSQLDRVIEEFILVMKASQELTAANRKLQEDMIAFFCHSRLEKIVRLLVDAFLDSLKPLDLEHPETFDTWVAPHNALRRLCQLVTVLYQLPFDCVFATDISAELTVSILSKLERVASELQLAIDSHFRASPVRRAPSINSPGDSQTGSTGARSLSQMFVIRSDLHHKYNMINLASLMVTSFAKPNLEIARYFDSLSLDRDNTSRIVEQFYGFSNSIYMSFAHYGIDRGPDFAALGQLHHTFINRLKLHAFFTPDIGGRIKKCNQINLQVFQQPKPSTPPTVLETVQRYSYHYECVTKTGNYRKYLEPPKKPEWLNLFESPDEAEEDEQNQNSQFAQRVSGPESTVEPEIPGNCAGIEYNIGAPLTFHQPQTLSLPPASPTRVGLREKLRNIGYRLLRWSKSTTNDPVLGPLKEANLM